MKRRKGGRVQNPFDRLRASPFDRLTPSPQEVERLTGLRVVIRGVRLPSPNLKGRLYRREDVLFVEFNDINPGFFWHIETVQKLLELAAAGFEEAQIFDQHKER